MVVMTEAFLQHHEKAAIEQSYLMYVDDSHARFDNIQQVTEFKSKMNQQSPNMAYTT